MFNQTNKTVKPIDYANDEEITEGSEKLIEFHKTNYLKHEKLIMQRHHLRMIPISTINYTYNETSDKYFIYGTEMRVYCPNFPRSTCTLM